MESCASLAESTGNNSQEAATPTSRPKFFQDDDEVESDSNAPQSVS